MGPHAQRNDIDTDTEKAAGEHTVPPPPPTLHRFTLLHDEFGDTGFGHEQYEGLRARPPSGCEPVDWGGFALKC